MLNITIISGSIRQSRNSHRVSLSINNLLNASGTNVSSIIDLAAEGLPLMTDAWDKHLEQSDAFQKIVAQLEKSDAFIWVSPEYNGSYTPALKNFIDNFPLRVFKKKPVGMVSVSTGSIGGIRGGVQMQQLALAIQAYALPQMLLVPQVHLKFSEDGTLIDENFNKFINIFTNELIWLGEAVKLKHTI
jgi:NAD(P)H-dependent FMN reductase